MTKPGTGTTLIELEWSWYAQRVAGGPLADMKRRYWSLGSLPTQMLTDKLETVEISWLQMLTGVSNPYPGELWANAVKQYTGVNPTVVMSENKRTFYALASIA